MTAIVANESVNADLLRATAFISVATGGTAANSSIDGVTFTARTLATSTAWSGVASSSRIAVAVASGNRTINSSPDGITWTATALALPSTAAWSNITWGESVGLFAAISTTSSNAAASSPDGITWTSRTLPSSSNWLGLNFGNGYYIATVGGGSTAAAYSTNGTSWNSTTLSVSGDWRSVCWGNTGGNGTWVAVSYNSANATYSTDNGATWNTASLPSTANWSSVVYGNGVFVTVAFGSTKAAYSTDGITWNPSVLPTSLNWITIDYNPGLKRFAAVAQSSTSGCATSLDGIAWTTRTVVSATWTAICAAPIAWSSGDTLTINNGSVVTVDTNQTKFWKTITIADGKLKINNTSTSTPIVFAMGRNTGATLNSIVPSNGLGTIEITGNWIEIGTSSGAANQTMDALYTEHIPCVWVETGSGTGVYEVWLNATGGYGDNIAYPFDNLNIVGNNYRGKFFTQGAGTLPAAITLSGGVSTTTKYVTVTSTSGVFPGASISGTGITAASVVDEVVNSTTLRLNIPTTASAGPNTYTLYNPYTSQFSSTITFGDGIDGKIPVSGAKVRIPNICITDFTPANLMTSDRTLSAQFLMTGGGNLTADKCLFSESHLIGTQAQTMSLTNSGFSLHPVITESYNVLINSVGMAVQPDRRYFTTFWITRLTRTAGSPAWSYISNASVTDLSIVTTHPQSYTGTAATTAVLALSFTQNATFTNLKLYCQQPIKASQYGLYLSDTVSSCTFTDLEVYGAGVISTVRSNGNTFNGIRTSDTMFSHSMSFTSGTRIGSSVITGEEIADNVKRYFKTRAFRDWTDLTRYHESREYSCTPYLAADKFHPWQFGVRNSDTTTNIPTWTQRAPSASTVTYEIYRSATSGFTDRNRATRLFSTGTAATVTMNDSGVYNAVASNAGTVFVAVGNNATVAMSGDGTATWTTRTAISGNWKAVAWNGTNFAAVGNAGAVSQTTTGAANWTTRTCISGNWAGIAAGPANQFCAVGNTDSYCMTSADSGVTWTQRICIPGDWTAIAWNGTVYAAVGNNGTTSMTSTDGISWTSRTITDGNWASIAWNGTYFVAVGNNGTTSTRSTDGITWGAQTITAGDWKSVAVFGTTFCAVGNVTDGVVGTVLTSTDGATWTPQSTLGTELLTAGAGWTVTAGWVQSPAGTFTHSSGTTTISHSATIVSTALYRLSWTITGRTTGSITITVGGQTYAGITASGSWDIPAATSAGGYTVTPTTGFDGAISAQTLKVRHAFGWGAIAAGSARWVAVGAENTGLVTMNSTDGVAWNRSIGIAGAATNGTQPQPSNKTKYYYVLRKYNVRIANPATNTGTTGQYTVTTNQNYNNIATQAVVNCRGVSGSPIVRAIGSNFDTLGIIPGMLVTGTGVPGGTTVLSVDSYYQITLSSNLTSTIYDSTMNFGLVAGMYVFGTGIGQNAKIASIDSDTQITLDVPHESDVSGILNFATATESPEQEVYTQGWATTRTNLCLQSNDLTQAVWVKTSTTVTTNIALAPNEIFFVAGNTLTITADRLAATAGGGTCVQTITTITGATYTFSAYIMANNAAPQTLAAGTLSLGTANQAFTASQTWQRISVTFTATGTSTDAKITITNNTDAIILTGMQVELGSVATPPIPTVAAAVTSGGTELTGILGLSKASSGNISNEGIQINYTAAGLWTEFYMSTTSGFTPGKENMIGMSIPVATPKFVLNTSSNNTFDTLTQVGVAGLASSMISLVTASNNTFSNFIYDVNYGSTATSQLLLMSNLCNNNRLYNWDITGLYNSTAAVYPLGGASGTTNNNSTLLLQNLRFNNYDIPLNNNYIGTICKGVSGGSHAPLSGTATTAALGTTTDGVALAYQTIYDTIFNELYHGTTKGALYLLFNASASDTPPYTILSGNPKFANSGRLYFETAGDSIEYTWPHKIYGVSGFDKLGYKTSGVDIGNDLTTGFAIKVEYAIDTGSGYGAYQEAIPANISAETVSASNGFYLKLKLTAIANMKYSSRTSKFVVGETLTGVTSGATAVLDDDENGAAGTVGTLRLSSITGSFIPGEIVKSGSTNRATNVATNTSFALGPSFTSYIDGLEIYTTIDTSVHYPLERPYITLTGLIPGSEVRVFTTAGSVELAGTESVATSTFSSQYDYYADVNVYIVIMSLGYKPITYYDQTLGINGLTIPVQQEVDRNYANA